MCVYFFMLFFFVSLFSFFSLCSRLCCCFCCFLFLRSLFLHLLHSDFRTRVCEIVWMLALCFSVFSFCFINFAQWKKERQKANTTTTTIGQMSSNVIFQWNYKTRINQYIRTQTAGVKRKEHNNIQTHISICIYAIHKCAYSVSVLCLLIFQFNLQFISVFRRSTTHRIYVQPDYSVHHTTSSVIFVFGKSQDDLCIQNRFDTRYIGAFKRSLLCTIK